MRNGQFLCCDISFLLNSKTAMMIILWLMAVLVFVDAQKSLPASTTSPAPKLPCPSGFHGPECKDKCSPNCASPECNVVTGVCQGGCKDGWYGDRCEDVCPQGSFGLNCSMECSRNCFADLCEPVLGLCEKGCTPGWVGRRCSNVCRQGYHGDKCRTKCSNNCATNECHHQSGYCLKGCKTGFWGSDCSLFGDIQDIPEPMRARFYSKLTAESRSVLLYLLMGEYERTLETAQLDIKRGIKQRNELKNLING